MEHADRLRGHVLLPMVELLALPASIVATAVVLFVGAIALHAVRFVGALVALGSDALVSAIGLSIPVITPWNDFVHAAVVFATLVALLSFGALAVSLYRRIFETFDDLQPETAVLIPLLGVSPGIYDLANTGSVDLPWWAFAFTVLWAHALVFRTIAIDGLLDGDRRTSLLVGSVVAIPAVGSEVLLVADRVGPSGVFSVSHHYGVTDLAQATFDAISGSAPLTRSLLLFVPLGVTFLYGIRWAIRAQNTTEWPPLRMAAIRRPRSPDASDSAEQWVPTSPSPKLEADGSTSTEDGTGEGDPTDATIELTADESTRSTGEDEANEIDTDPDDEWNADKRFGDTRIFTNLPNEDGDGRSGVGEPCSNCGGAISIHNDVGFCPHCGAIR